MQGRKEKSERYAHVLNVGNKELDGAVNRKLKTVWTVSVRGR